MKRLFIFILSSTSLHAQVNQATFMDIAQCPANAAKLILDQKIEPTKIHTCTSSFENLYETPDKIEIVNVSYDDPISCSPSCIYKTISAVVEFDRTNPKFTEVPSKESVSFTAKTLPTYTLRSTRKDFTCQSYNIEELLKRSYGKKLSDWGLFIELSSPYVCTWTEDNGNKTRAEWSGIYFTKKTTNLDSINEIKYLEKRI